MTLLPAHATIEAYSQGARETAKHQVASLDGLTYNVLKLNGEAGEVADLLGKTYTDRPMDWGRLYDELGDVVWHLSEACRHAGTSLEEVCRRNLAKLAERHGATYDAAHYAEGRPS